MGVRRPVFDRAAGADCHFDIHHASIYQGTLDKGCLGSKKVKIVISSFGKATCK